METSSAKHWRVAVPAEERAAWYAADSLGALGELVAPRAQKARCGTHVSERRRQTHSGWAAAQHELEAAEE